MDHSSITKTQTLYYFAVQLAKIVAGKAIFLKGLILFYQELTR